MPFGSEEESPVVPHSAAAREVTRLLIAREPAAAPLLLGMGTDYGIHVSLALRRGHGDVAPMWRGTGKAVVFCGISTAIGFGSLCFASNDGMASLGAVAVISFLTSMSVSVCLLPGWLVNSR